MPVLHDIAIGLLPLVPNPIMRKLAAPYIAGEELEEALDKLGELNQHGFPGILDILGEEVTDEDEARSVADSYLAAADALAQRGLDAYVSIKPTHVGIRVSEELAYELYGRIATRCAELGLWMRVEMEDHTTTDATLRVFERLRVDHDNVGIVLQSRLLRTPGDIDRFAPGPLSVRLVKGIYIEPKEIAHVDGDAITDAFVDNARQLFERGASVAFATHDEVLAERLLAVCEELDVAPERYEFQVLLGVRKRLWAVWRDQGQVVRVYVPFGPQWRAYSSRRMKKNPQIFRYVVRDTLRLGR
jgi:proline dehydrogenase